MDVMVVTDASIWVSHLRPQVNLPLLSWDKEQLERAGNLLTTYTPSTYPFEKPEPMQPAQ